MKVKIKGFFYNKLLLFKFGFANAPNCQNHCLFYIDIVNNLRQGYISINKQSEDEILKELKNSEPFEIFKNHKLIIKDLSFRKTVPNEFSIFIHNIDEKPIIKNDIPNNNDLKNNINIMKVNHIQIKLNEDLNKKNIENLKNVKLLMNLNFNLNNFVVISRLIIKMKRKIFPKMNLILIIIKI